MKIVWDLPIKTVSEANVKEHWTYSSKRHRFQQQLIKGAFRRAGCVIVLPCVIRMVRLSSRKLDVSDNLPMAFKWIKDQIADCILPKEVRTYIDKKGKLRALKGRTDDHEGLKWEYDQEQSKECRVRIEIQDSSLESATSNPHAL